MIDWTFIGREEGERLNGYVPDQAGSNSGVTIAGGVDLSAWNIGSLSGLPLSLRTKLNPYLGLRGRAAVAYLAANPLTLTNFEADALDAFARAAEVDLLTGRYDRDGQVTFDELPDRAQTVIASVAFQYGDLASRCPKFWHCATGQDWTGLRAELLNFGDRYPTRRRAEADYLIPLLQD